MHALLTFLMLLISIHAPTRGATYHRYFQEYIFLYFNPRSHERSDFIFSSCHKSKFYFNPRSHERSDIPACLLRGTIRISIHAPTRGATSACAINLKACFISIHAPTRGATVTILIFGGVYHISIHAPTRGATKKYSHYLSDVSNFNPRSHERSDSTKSFR